MAAKNGKDGTALIGATPLLIGEWRVNAKANTSDSTDSGTAGGATDHTVGRKEADITLSAPLDHTTPQNVTLAAGTIISNLNLTTDGTKKYVFASATVTEIETNVQISTGETVAWRATLKSKGAWTEFA